MKARRGLIPSSVLLSHYEGRRGTLLYRRGGRIACELERRGKRQVLRPLAAQWEMGNLTGNPIFLLRLLQVDKTMYRGHSAY